MGARRRPRDPFAPAVAGPSRRPSLRLARTIGVSPNRVLALIARARTEKLAVKKRKGYALKP